MSATPLLDDILADWAELLGDDFNGYLNHCRRMSLCCMQLHNCDEDDIKKIQIASAFHDLGIWIEDTVDYIGPSVPPAMAYLKEHGLEHWSEEIQLMITEHHKITKYSDSRFPLVEVFRKGDAVDFTGGLVRFGIDGAFVKDLKARYPNEGFHKMLAKRAGKWFLKHPLNPAPMMKW